MEEINQNPQIPQPPSSSEPGQQRGVLDQLKGYWQNRRFRLVFTGLILLFFAGFIGWKIWWLNIEKQAYKNMLESESKRLNQSQQGFFPSPTPTPMERSSSQPTSTAAPSAFQNLLAQKCKYTREIDPYLKVININELPIKFEPWIVSAYFNKQVANCDEGESVNSGFVILKFGELSLYDKYSKQAGRGGEPSIGLVGKTIQKSSNIELTAYLGEGFTIIVGEIPVIVRGEKKLTLQNGEVVYINVSRIAIEENDPRLIAILNNYAGQSDIYGNKKQINRWGYEEAIIKRFFSDLSNLESPEKETIEQVKKILAGVFVK